MFIDFNINPSHTVLGLSIMQYDAQDEYTEEYIKENGTMVTLGFFFFNIDFYL